MPAYLPPIWQLAQATVWCLPVRGKRVVLWLKLAGVQPFVVWHVAHVVGKPAATWFGFLVAWYLAWWQA